MTFGQAIRRHRAAGQSAGASLRAAWVDVRAGRAQRPPRRRKGRNLPRVNAPRRRPSGPPPRGADITWYRGYSILKMPAYYAADSAYRIEKGGHHLSWARSIEDAKGKIDAVVGTNPAREHRPRVRLVKRGAVMVLGKRSPYKGRVRRVNPPAGAVRIYDRLLAIEARKGGRSAYPGKAFRHDFRRAASVWGLPDGSLLIRPR